MLARCYARLAYNSDEKAKILGISIFGHFNEVGITKPLEDIRNAKRGTTSKSCTRLKFRWCY